MDNAVVTLVASRFRDGGVERRMNRLAAGLMEAGVHCEFLLGESGSGAAGDAIPSAVTVRQVRPRELMGSLQAIVRGRQDQKHAVLVFRTPDYSPVLRTLQRLGETRPPTFIVNGDYITARLDPRNVGWVRAWKQRRRLRRDWCLADGIITTCQPMGDAWRGTGVIEPERIHEPRPPVVGDDILEMAQAPIDHPWPGFDGPIVLGIGRLTPNKRFQLLIEAFARLRGRRDARLVILGRGPEEDRLEHLAEKLGIRGDVAFPGYMTNAYAWMSRAAVVALPSVVEPLGLVLLESLFVGRPFVAAGTPPGPRVIRNDTGQGSIVEEDTPAAMADALDETLRHPPDPDSLHRAARPYDYRNSAREYLNILFPETSRMEVESGLTHLRHEP